MTKNILIFFVLLSSMAFAQEAPKTDINEIISSVNTLNDSLAIEKLYLQTDKPSYFSGDTLWFKAYLFNASSFNASTKSGIMYVEIANDSNRVVTRIMLPVFNGLASGQIALNEQEIPQGGYTLRAYTNWMRNFGEDYIVKKPIYIGNANDKDWLVNYSIQPLTNTEQGKMQLSLELDRIDKSPLGLRELQVQIADEKKTWFKNNLETNIDGLLTLDFELPQQVNSKNLTLNLQDLRKNEGNRKLSIPISLNRPEFIDLQFMPEGGNLVAGLPAHIAFKAINEDGLGTDVSGKIFNSSLQEVAEFQSTHRGIGTFNFTPLESEVYSARIELPNGLYNSYPLPTTKSTGITMAVNNSFQSDSCELIIHATPNTVTGPYFLVGQARGIALYGASFNLGKDSLKLKISKDIFPSGITKFTLIGPDNNVLNERIIFIDHDDNLRIQLTSNQTSYQLRDSVSLAIEVTDKNGMPVQGSFSLAVTDDGQVKTDSLTNGSIISQILLTADLKGTVEDPGYYSQSAKDSKKWQDLDQLLLAQGWVSYDWDKVFKEGPVLPYAAEPEFLIKGKVVNMFNKPVANSGIVLLSKKPFLTLDTITNEQGLFIFKDIQPVDTAVFFIQARNKNGKSSNVGIEMEEFSAPDFTPLNKRMVPWYVNTDTVKLLSVNKQIQLEKDQEEATSGTLLKAVVIEGRKVIKDSKNLNGPGGADVVIDEEVLEKVGRMTLGDLLYKNIEGFGVRTNSSGERYYTVYTKFVHLIIDGTDTEFFMSDSASQYEYFKDYFDYYDAEEIKGIEVMTSTRNALAYVQRFLNPLAKITDHIFIEVTTRSGHGPFLKKSIGTYLFKPMAFTLPREFYSPKYKASSTVDMTDIRSTIYWEPFITTDKDGKATVSFYTADNPGSYSIIIEGSDMQGNLGSTRSNIKLKNK
ncbi:hypothetical protein [Albibacterium bauzanense]|uniref:MG2 domain-containing protein n=1 Tax=Albibacterium bauzanense TaxID=653929 RepID=A0A4R1LR24_9SPHI|nr:hypothetical protein [Albibacterium bauzanense]TCK80764.1 hypothetical protein C8N28_2518 [Albibacterium bauzanense]